MRRVKFKILLILLLGVIQHGSALSRVDPLVDSKAGLIRGLSATDGDYSMFMGIPYATVNRTNPFGHSIPHPSFEDIFEAYDDSAKCPQIEVFNKTIVGTLDCLHLNIYVPNSANSRNKLPVLVWIHGGGFAQGFSGRYVYGPRYLVKQNIILVTLNYRLGAYGFMCLDTPDVPGNQGIKDQQLALKWINENIDAFGGDSDKVTIYGESAGGTSVDFYLLYEQEKLFDKVIIQSGVAVAPPSVVDPDISAPLKLAKHLGFTTTDIEESLAFLTTVDTNLLVASTAELGLEFRPCVEKYLNTTQKLIYDDPVNMEKLNLRDIPILIGHNKDESLVTYETKSSAKYANIFHSEFVKYFNFDDKELHEMEELVRHFYIGDEKVSEEVKAHIIRFSSDFLFNYPTLRTIQKYVENGDKNIFYFLFAYDGGRNYVKRRENITTPGTAHADEMGYIFDISYMGEPTPEDQLIIDRITTLWANFVKFGNPTPQVTELLPAHWPAVTKDSLNYLYIDTELKVKKRPFKSRMAFWELFYKHNKKAEKGYKDSSKTMSRC